jgi:flagellar biosynthetic protein FliQ
MDEAVFLEISNKALISMMVVALPILIPALVAGIMISLFQAVTQISEQTLTFVPKLIVLIVSYLIAGPWIIQYIANYSKEIINKMPEMGLS